MTPPTHRESVQSKLVAESPDNHRHCEGEARGNPFSFRSLRERLMLRIAGMRIAASLRSSQ